MPQYWTPLQQRRISRRRLLAAAGAGTTAVAALGLLGPGARPAARAGATPRYGGRYRFATTFDWGTIDPVVSVAGGPTLFPRIYNTLLNRSARDPRFFFLDLADAIEQPDDETYIFSIRPAVRIAPNRLGVPERDLDASDALRWLERVAARPDALLRLLIDDWIESFEAPDARTFVIRTNGPYAYFLFRLGNPLGGCIPPREFFDRGLSLFDQGAGAGPFGVIVPGTFSERGEIVLQRNPHYYRRASNGNRLPYVDRIEAIRIVDRTPRRTAFLDRQIDEYTPADRAETDELLGLRPDLRVVEEPFNTFVSFVMNPQRPPWDDERIRKAALHALNRQEFVDRIVGPDGGRPNGLVHWPLGDFALPPEELEELQPYDPARSRELIMQATGQETIEIDVMYPVTNIEFHDRHLPIFLQQMEEAGFLLNQEPLDFAFWLDRYTRVDYDASLALNQIYETPEIPLDFHAAQGPQGDGNFAIGIGVLVPDVEEAIQDSKRSVDPEEHIELVRRAQRLIYEHGPAFLPIMSWLNFTLIHPFVRNPYQAHGLGNTGLFFSDFWLSADAPVAGAVGDASCDGHVNSIDAALVLQQEARLLSSLPCDHSADVSGDGRVNSVDAALILQRNAGLIPPFS